MNKILEELFNINSNYVKTINSKNIISGDDLMNSFEFIDAIEPLIKDVAIRYYEYMTDDFSKKPLAENGNEMFTYFINHVYKTIKQ